MYEDENGDDWIQKAKLLNRKINIHFIEPILDIQSVMNEWQDFFGDNVPENNFDEIFEQKTGSINLPNLEVIDLEEYTFTETIIALVVIFCQATLLVSGQSCFCRRKISEFLKVTEDISDDKCPLGDNFQKNINYCVLICVPIICAGLYLYKLLVV